MSGYVFMVGGCVACGRVISFNPHKVPSIRVNGEREPLCRGCFEAWNNIHRIGLGLDPVPLATDAYEPIPEEAL